GSRWRWRSTRWRRRSWPTSGWSAARCAAGPWSPPPAPPTGEPRRGPRRAACPVTGRKGAVSGTGSPAADTAPAARGGGVPAARWAGRRPEEASSGGGSFRTAGENVPAGTGGDHHASPGAASSRGRAPGGGTGPGRSSPATRPCRTGPGGVCSGQDEALVAVGGHLVADLPVAVETADVEHEDPRLAGHVGAQVPGVGHGVEGLVGDLVDVLHPGVLLLQDCLGARQPV